MMSLFSFQMYITIQELAQALCQSVILSCGCEIPYWRFLFNLGLNLEAGSPKFYCPFDGCETVTDSPIRRAALRFMNLMRTAEGVSTFSEIMGNQ